jgi:hypothetical protein
MLCKASRAFLSSVPPPPVRLGRRGKSKAVAGPLKILDLEFYFHT